MAPTIKSMVDGRWSMVDGRWSMVDGRWSMMGLVAVFYM